MTANTQPWYSLQEHHRADSPSIWIISDRSGLRTAQAALFSPAAHSLPCEQCEGAILPGTAYFHRYAVASEPARPQRELCLPCVEALKNHAV